MLSEKMQRAVRKLHSRISNPNCNYQSLNSSSSDEKAPLRSPPSDVPEGFLAVYVGDERQRFVISANYLKHQMFKLLLEKSAEEYGFEHKGGLPIACDVAYFEHLLWSIKSQSPSGTFQVNYCSCFSVYSYPR